MSRESQKCQFRKIILSSIGANEIKNSSVKWNPKIIEELLVVDEPYNKLTEDERFIIYSFYSKIIKYFAYVDIDWDYIDSLSKWPTDSILGFSLSQLIIEEQHNETNRLKISNDLIKRLMFDKWVIQDKEKNEELTFYVPKTGLTYYAIDLSTMNFNNVVFDYKMFLKTYVADKEKYKIISCPSTEFMTEDEAISPLEKLRLEEELYEVEMDPDWAIQDSNYEENDISIFDEYEIDDDDILSEEEIKDFHDEAFILDDERIEAMPDLMIDFAYTNANINFKTNKLGYFRNCDFLGTDLSNSHLEECDGIHMSDCTFYGTNIKLPKDDSNIVNCLYDMQR